jgi:hypothetical protein
VKDLELMQWAVLGLSATGVAYTILGLSAAYLALIAAKEANRWAYYMYELALVAIRLQLMQLCAGTLPVRVFSVVSSLLVPPTKRPSWVVLLPLHSLCQFCYFSGFKPSLKSIDG